MVILGVGKSGPARIAGQKTTDVAHSLSRDQERPSPETAGTGYLQRDIASMSEQLQSNSNPTTHIDPDVLYTGPEVDRILHIHPASRWRLTKQGRLVARRPFGPGTQPRYLGRDVLALRDAT